MRRHRSALTGWTEKRLRAWLSAFFVALAIPSGILVWQTYSSLKWEAFYRHRVMAEELGARVERRVADLIAGEESRAFADYTFLMVAGDPAAGFFQRSPLSAYPVTGPIPGLIGHFQIDADGGFSTPLVPAPGTQAAAYGIPQDELAGRRALRERMLRILDENRLLPASETDEVAQRERAAGAVARPDGAKDDRDRSTASRPALEGAEAPAPQAAFDRLNEAVAARRLGQKKQQALGSVDDLKLKRVYPEEFRSSPEDKPAQARAAPAPVEQRALRKERGALPEPPAVTSYALPAPPPPVAQPLHIRAFESEIEKFNLALLDSGHFVLFRRVWRDGRRYIQGALIDPQRFLNDVVGTAFRATALSRVGELAVAFHDDVLSAYSGQPSRAYLSSTEDFEGALLYRSRLAAPFDDLALIFSITELPMGSGGPVVLWTGAILLLLLGGGGYASYRLGVGQITLQRQQQDFVSAVSHELKTPLTSIRMYGEILREGWADEDKKRMYYEYIHDESERLSRLIANVLQLARMTRNELDVDLQPIALGELLDQIESKVASQIERSGFTLRIECADEAKTIVVNVDADYFSQILINLVDNALKFAAAAEQRCIDIACRQQSGGAVCISVRDYGPGVPPDQIKKIFGLFYRSENELTRETAGTGIGLALVHQLAVAMNARVDVVNREPGAEFRVSFPRQQD